MVSYSFFKNTLLFSLILIACGNSAKSDSQKKNASIGKEKVTYTGNHNINTGADNPQKYFPLLQGKKVGVVTNQTGIVLKRTVYSTEVTHGKAAIIDTIHLVDYLVENKINVQRIYAPEHGFRGTADAGELVKDGRDTKTGLPVISLYGNNKKPSPEQLKGIDVLVFDLQDIGARFYTYISSLHYIMEACAEQGIPLIVLDRPNPNGGIIDGPTLEKENSSFVGMHTIPVLHGMTIGEYGQMINGEKWLKNGVQCALTVIPCTQYKRDMAYSLPFKPSPNIPNDRAVNLYASLCFFEGTNVSVGRGTDKQFQIYGSPDLPATGFSFTPQPNVGAKDPVHKGVKCYGEDLTKGEPVTQIELRWLLNAYNATADKSKFFNDFFIKLAGTAELKKQIEAGKTEKQIRESWQPGLERFKNMRKKYLIYGE